MTVRSFADYFPRPKPPQTPPPLIARLAWAGRITLFASPEGWGKSTHATAGCAAVTTGAEFLGETCPAGTVLWARVEEAEADLMARAFQYGADAEHFAVCWPESPH